MINILDNEIETPFQPSNPVKPEYFKGRLDVIRKIIRYTPNALKCEPQHFFLTGKKAMGKTSISDFVMEYLIEEYNMACSYTSNKGNNSIEFLCSDILVNLLNNLPKQSRLEKVKTWFGKHVSEVEFAGTKIRLNIDEDKQKIIKNDFLTYLNQAFEDLKDNYNGLFIVIDDINGLSNNREFVDWYKRLADTAFVDRFIQIPVYFLLIGYPEKFDSLVEMESSFGRIFYYADINELDDGDVNEFFTETFDSIGVSIEEDALDLMIKYTSGVPLTMQQIGDSIFWNLTTNNITVDMAKKGIIDAADELANRQIRRIIYHVDSPVYEKILLKIASDNLSTFTSDSLKEILSGDEYEQVDEFISNMLDIQLLKVYDKWKDRIEYEFTEKTFYTYYNIKSSPELHVD